MRGHSIVSPYAPLGTGICRKFPYNGISSGQLDGWRKKMRTAFHQGPLPPALATLI